MDEENDELMFDWDRYDRQALDWERHEARFRDDWERAFPHGPAWDRIADYHRYGYAAGKLYAAEPRGEVIARIRRGFDRGDWETRDPWEMIETALHAGWNEAVKEGQAPPPS